MENKEQTKKAPEQSLYRAICGAIGEDGMLEKGFFLPRARRRLRAVSLAVTVPLLVFLFAAIVPEAPFPAERIGVAVYGLVIAAMLYSALQYDGGCAAGFRCAALLFVFSDAVIAWNRFIGPVPARTWIVMTTYYLAQYLFFRFAFKTAARN